MRNVPPALMPIFRSKAQAELLARVLLHPGEQFSLTDLAAHTGVALSTMHREVAQLITAGILTDRYVGRTRLISAADTPVVAPLRHLVMLTYGPPQVIAEEFALVGVEKVIIFGSWAARYEDQPGRQPNDIDVLLVGDVSRLQMYTAAELASERIGKPVNPAVCSVQVWANPEGDVLVSEIQKSPHLTVFEREAE
ncbi:ArsR family transcriptional regulator (plasmid) [Rhodococcus sp. H-CA8f]|uniref:winged helix-turn-helix domain-containing protein n=1 Tax=Rhodococcus sp. H-CA8f TaxID=1727214 RepID=UPI000BE36348|nr:winged helix-turn-helix domain-containing protein [Rhodococcus sp. H-CA8f]ATI36358.1 ArsR family transcriptional regulator [Rhodococcus sp. H-CA8f]